MIVITNLNERGGASAYASKLVDLLFAKNNICSNAYNVSWKESLSIVFSPKGIVLIGLEARLLLSVWLRLIIGLPTHYIAHSSVQFELSVGVKYSIFARYFERLLLKKAIIHCVSKNCRKLFGNNNFKILPPFYFSGIDTLFMEKNFKKLKSRRNFLYLGGKSNLKGAKWVKSLAPLLNEPIIAPGYFISNESNIKITPYFDKAKLNEAYKKVKALIVPSVNDSFGLVVLEALQFGCPVVCTNSVGVVDYLPSLAKYSVNYKDTTGLIDKLNKLDNYPFKQIIKEINYNVRELDVSYCFK